jgi:hypothetical protein
MLKLRVQYRRLVAEEKKKRKYLEGALMRELPGAGYYRIDAMKGRAVLDIDIMREKALDRMIGRRNFYCDHIYDREILDASLQFAVSMKKGRPVREDGSFGCMYGAGVRFPGRSPEETNEYEFKSCSLAKREITLSNEKLSRRKLLSGPLGRDLSLFLDAKVPEVMGSIRYAEKLRKTVRPEYMTECPAATCIVSWNLVNPMHIDLDHSMSVVYWVGDEQEDCYFVLPNVVVGGREGVVVKVRPGTLIGWDGRTTFHCTACKEYKGDCYGVFFASVHGAFGGGR